MVAILFVLTITILLLVDWSLQLVQAKRARKRALLINSGSAVPIKSNPFTPPQGLFFHPTHTWAQVEPAGTVKVGLDGLVSFVLGNIDGIELPAAGSSIKEGSSLTTILQGSRKLTIKAPFDGEIVDINRELIPDGHFIQSEPYGAGWICEIRPKSLSKGISRLMVGDDVVKWHANEAKRIIGFLSSAETDTETLTSEGLMLRGFMESASDDEWQRFQREFLDGKAGGSRKH